MAIKANFNFSVEIIDDTTGKLKYRHAPTTFQSTFASYKGPAPGALLVGTEGTVIDLSEFTTPGLIIITNEDANNYVEYGVYDGSTFRPCGEVPAGEFYPWRLARSLISGVTGTGTGTITNDLMIVADTADCEVIVRVFEA